MDWLSKFEEHERFEEDLLQSFPSLTPFVPDDSVLARTQLEKAACSLFAGQRWTDVVGWRLSMSRPPARRPMRGLIASPDIVKITVWFEHEKVPYTQFTLLKHQIGLEGLDAVLQMLAGIAPMLDSPMDIRRAAKEGVLDLT